MIYSAVFYATLAIFLLGQSVIAVRNRFQLRSEVGFVLLLVLVGAGMVLGHLITGLFANSALNSEGDRVRFRDGTRGIRGAVADPLTTKCVKIGWPILFSLQVLCAAGASGVGQGACEAMESDPLTPLVLHLSFRMA
ncbi:hypothetical protein V8E36_001338 [Tilletia maclaganii]